MQARSDVRDFQYGGIELDNLTETNDRRVALLRIARAQKLPPVVVLIVSDVQDWPAAEDN